MDLISSRRVLLFREWRVSAKSIHKRGKKKKSVVEEKESKVWCECFNSSGKDLIRYENEKPNIYPTTSLLMQCYTVCACRRVSRRPHTCLIVVVDNKLIHVIERCFRRTSCKPRTRTTNPSRYLTPSASQQTSRRNIAAIFVATTSSIRGSCIAPKHWGPHDHGTTIHILLENSPLI